MLGKPEDTVPNDPIGKRIREVVIGDIEPQSIVVADYDPAWLERFRREEARIRAALGEAALSVEHIGSTSVPGLAAKPIVDVLLVVDPLSRTTNWDPSVSARKPEHRDCANAELGTGPEVGGDVAMALGFRVALSKAYPRVAERNRVSVDPGSGT